jgi:hypothetical protein
MADETPIAGGAPITTETPAVKTFTQAELDHQINERLKREREKYADYDTLKTAAATLKTVEDAQKTEAQKLADRLGEIEKQLGLKDTTIAELQGKLQGATREQKVMLLATSAGAIDPSDANILAATNSVDPTSPTADEEIKAKIEALKASKPYLFSGKAAPHVEGFNPANTPGVVKTDAQVFNEIVNRVQGKGYGPLG